MKYIIVALALIFAVVSAKLHTAEEVAKMKEFTKECRKSSHADHEKILRMRQGHFDDNQNLKDYMFCFFKKMGWQHEDGTIDKDKVMSKMTKSEADSKAMSRCINKQGTNGPDTAYSIYKCYRKALLVAAP